MFFEKVILKNNDLIKDYEDFEGVECVVDQTPPISMEEYFNYFKMHSVDIDNTDSFEDSASSGVLSDFGSLDSDDYGDTFELFDMIREANETKCNVTRDNIQVAPNVDTDLSDVKDEKVSNVAEGVAEPKAEE